MRDTAVGEFLRRDVGPGLPANAGGEVSDHSQPLLASIVLAISLQSTARVLTQIRSCSDRSSGLSIKKKRGREQNSAMHHIYGNAQWSGDQLHVRLERRL